MSRILITLLLGISAAMTFAGCATNYEFHQAARDDGEYDVEKLVLDLAKKPQLYETIGVPFLLEWRVTDFRHEGVDKRPAAAFTRSQIVSGVDRGVPGYTLTETRDLGPFGFFWSSAKQRYYNDSRVAYETRQYSSLLADLWSTDTTTVHTPFGPRTEVQHYFLFGLLPVRESTDYESMAKAFSKDNAALATSWENP